MNLSPSIRHKPENLPAATLYRLKADADKTGYSAEAFYIHRPGNPSSKPFLMANGDNSRGRMSDLQGPFVKKHGFNTALNQWAALHDVLWNEIPAEEVPPDISGHFLPLGLSRSGGGVTWYQGVLRPRQKMNPETAVISMLFGSTPAKTLSLKTLALGTAFTGLCIYIFYILANALLAV